MYTSCALTLCSICAFIIYACQPTNVASAIILKMFSWQASHIGQCCRCRLRKKSWTNPGTVYLDTSVYENDIPIYPNWEIFLEVLSGEWYTSMFFCFFNPPQMSAVNSQHGWSESHGICSKTNSQFDSWQGGDFYMCGFILLLLFFFLLLLKRVI